MVSSAAAGSGGRGPVARGPPVPEGDDGDISLSMARDGPARIPLAAAPRRLRDMDAGAIPAPQAGRMWPPGAAAQIRSASARPACHDDEGDVAARPRSAAAWRPDSPSPSSSPSPALAHGSTPRAHVPATPTPPLSPLAGRRVRSHSLKVRIPSADLSAGHRDSVQSATSASTAELAVPPAIAAPSPRPPPLIDDDTAARMARWVKEVVVCNFDLERGPVVERRAGGRRWGPGVKENVAFSSFPDTSLFTEGSIQFSFKIRHVPPDPRTLAYPEPPSPLPGAEQQPEPPEPPSGADSNVLTTPDGRRDKAAEYRRWDERGREWMYGFVWFQQRRDRGIARGYMQKSVVILTHLPLPALWNAVLQRLAPAFFAHGYSALEVACHAFAAWPDPVPDAKLELGLLSDVLNVKLPDGTENPQVGLRSQPILASLPPSSPLRVFSTFISHLWSIWECLVLAEPVLVIAPDPRTCSEIVWWLRELLRPVPLAGDFRPYLHIHDHDFSLLVNSNKPQAGVVVGVTNPFFRNAASHWPNVIAVPSKTKPRPGPAQPGRQPEYPDGFISKRQRSVQKDRPLLKRLEALIAAGKLDDPEGNAALRTHFQQLTERFLVPLNRYFQTLVPPPTNGTNTPVLGGSGAVRPALSHSSSFNASIGPHPTSTTLPVPPPPPALSLSGLKPFSLPTFLSHLKNHGPNPLAFKTKGLLSKARVESDFYAAFCKGACFAGWLAARVESLGLAVAHSALAAQGLGTHSAARYSPDPFASARTSTSGTSTTTDGTSGRSSSETPGSAAAPTPRAEVLAASIPDGLTPISATPQPLPSRK